MTTSSSMALCPINFKALSQLMARTGNIESALLLSKINFHLKNSRIKRDGSICIARSRDQIASWFGFSKSKTDHLINSLAQSGFIHKFSGLWYGKKRLFIKSNQGIQQSPINMKLLNELISVTGSLKSALIFSRIAYAFSNSKIINDNEKWCCIKRQSLSDWSGFSKRSIDTILKGLISNKLILSKNFIYYGKRKTHFQITNTAIQLINNRFNKANEVSQDKVNPSSSSNNTSFNEIGDTLSPKQEKYVQSALNKTIDRFSLGVSNTTHLLEEVKYSITNKEQHKNITNFKHCVSRIMKILSSKNWRTPFGFNKYSDYGVGYSEKIKNKEKQWQKLKAVEIQTSNDLSSLTNQSPSMDNTTLNHENCVEENANLNRSIRIRTNSLETINNTGVINFSVMNDKLTKEALKLCEQISSIEAKYPNTHEPSIINFQHNLIHNIKKLVSQGADISEIKNAIT